MEFLNNWKYPVDQFVELLVKCHMTLNYWFIQVVVLHNSGDCRLTKSMMFTASPCAKKRIRLGCRSSLPFN